MPDLTLEQYRKIIDAAQNQPRWRRESDICCDYYDGKQIETELSNELRERGMGDIVANHIKPIINSILGIEAKNRTDWRPKVDQEEMQDMAEALAVKLAEAERETRADNAISDAYASQIKAGIGWVEVGRNPDVCSYPYRVEPVRRSEIWWDWSAVKPDISDARWLLRTRWMDADLLAQYMPEHKDLIRSAVGGWSVEYLELLEATRQTGMIHAYQRERSYLSFDDTWRREEQNEVLLREVWVKRPEKQTMLCQGKKKVLLDPNNPAHAFALQNGYAQAQTAIVQIWHVSLWIGPHKLCEHRHGKSLPYVPFFGYREDSTRVPYGMIRDMIPLQDEVNARRRKLLWMLSSKRVFVEADALDPNFNDLDDLAREIARADAMVVLNPNRRSDRKGIEIDSDLGLSNQQYQLMNDAETSIQKVAGIYNSLMGRTDRAASGTAINSLIEQGMNSIADINDNYSYARTKVGERLMALLLEDMTEDNIEVTVGANGSKKKVVLNQPCCDQETGLVWRENEISKIEFSIALSEVPSTPAYRQYLLVQLSEIIKSMPPQAQTLLVPYFIELTDQPRRDEIAEMLREKLGLKQADPQQDPEKMAMAQQMQQMQQLIEQGKAAYEEQINKLQEQLANRQTELGIKASEAEAETMLRAAQAEKLKAETRVLQANVLERTAALAAPIEPTTPDSPIP